MSSPPSSTPPADGTPPPSSSSSSLPAGEMINARISLMLTNATGMPNNWATSDELAAHAAASSTGGASTGPVIVLQSSSATTGASRWIVTDVTATSRRRSSSSSGAAATSSASSASRGATSSGASSTGATSTPASSTPASSTPASSTPASSTPASSTPASSTRARATSSDDMMSMLLDGIATLSAVAAVPIDSTNTRTVYCAVSLVGGYDDVDVEARPRADDPVVTIATRLASDAPRAAARTYDETLLFVTSFNRLCRASIDFVANTSAVEYAQGAVTAWIAYADRDHRGIQRPRPIMLLADITHVDAARRDAISRELTRMRMRWTAVNRNQYEPRDMVVIAILDEE